MLLEKKQESHLLESRTCQNDHVKKKKRAKIVSDEQKNNERCVYSDAGVDASYEVVDCIVCKIVSKKLVEGAVATLGYNCTALYDGCFVYQKEKCGRQASSV